MGVVEGIWMVRCRVLDKAGTMGSARIASLAGVLILTASLSQIILPHPAFATSSWAPWTGGYSDTYDYTDAFASGEWGLDVGLAPGTPIYTPEPGTMLTYEASASNACRWQPGRILEKLTTGQIVAFGHVNRVAADGSQVSGGQEIATVGDQSAWPNCPGPGQGPEGNHVEFQYDSSGGSTSQANNWVPHAAVSAGQGYSGCPHHAWAGGASYTSVDPCGILNGYMNGQAPGGTPPQPPLALVTNGGQLWAKDASSLNSG